MSSENNMMQGLRNRNASSLPVFVLKDVRQVKGGNLVLDGIDLELGGGAVTALIGPSGAGKTSLLRLLNRLDDPAGGRLLYNGHPIDEFPVQGLRRQVGFVFQTPVMFPGTVADNLRLASELGANNHSELEKRVQSVLALAELELALLDRVGDTLSVGQKQRVNIARALMTAPEVLLMDEPTSALDPETADRLMETIRRLSHETRLTVIMITHRLAEARQISDSVVLMESGRIVEAGTAARIFDRSEHSRLRAFLESDK
jgi:putative ABC transport system ATP-binding protein